MSEKKKPAKSAREHIGDQIKQIKWGRLALAFLAFVLLSVGFSWAVQREIDASHLPNIGLIAYGAVFFITFITNLSILIPIPFAVAFMVSAAKDLNPVMVAAVGAVGGSLGELSGYYAGYLGKKLAIPEGIPIYELVEEWVKRWGFWAIFVLGLQPAIPFDIGGFVAGAARMPMRIFFPALLWAKFLKYLLLIYAGKELIQFFFPFLRH